MTRNSTRSAPTSTALVTEAWEAVGASFERFCLTAGVATLARMMEEDATALCGDRHERSDGRAAYRWGRTKGKIGFHGGKVEVERPRVRVRSGAEVTLASWETALAEDLAWSMGDEPDADQRLDAQVRPRGAPARRRCSGDEGRWPFEIGGVAPLRVTFSGTDGRMDGLGPVPAGFGGRSRSTASTSRKNCCWWRRSGSTRRATSIRSG